MEKWLVRLADAHFWLWFAVFTYNALGVLYIAALALKDGTAWIRVYDF